MADTSRRAPYLGVVDLVRRACAELERSPTVDSGLLGRLLTEVGMAGGSALVAHAWAPKRISDQYRLADEVRQ